MTTPAARLSSALQTLNWSVTALSREAGVSVRMAQYWLSGRYEPPEETLAWLETLAAFHEAHPVPRPRRAA